MSENVSVDAGQQPESEKSQGGLLLSIFIVIPFVYILSTGPLFRLALNGSIPLESLQIYQPLGALYDNVPLVNRFFHWYLNDLWGIDIE